ncbi:hypothetical protein [Jonesia quinghaiensis]|uniref:hypothetical protein n=1 Tax=Jonesia quinghaiensis TaxID=262806 RepID=UPI0004175EC5|nr:hypothetical protein [Jonesia quinghaiensis]
MTNTRTATQASTPTMRNSRSALALLVAVSLLAGCASNSDAASPDDPSGATHSADGGEGTTGDDQEQQPAPDNPALDEAVKDWQPLSDFNIPAYDKPFGDFTADEMQVMSRSINRFAWGMTAYERSLLAEDTQKLKKDAIRWLPANVQDLVEDAFTRTADGIYPEDIRLFTNRLPSGSVILDSSVFTHSWHAEKFTYEDGTPGVELTLFWRIVYRYEDADGVIRALPVARWLALGTDSVQSSSQSSRWNFHAAVASPFDRCVMHLDGVITGQELNDVDVEEYKTLTTPHDAFETFDDWGGAPEPLTKGELKEVASACQPTTT